jgi:primase-polymerase (primpol)-like protein
MQIPTVPDSLGELDQWILWSAEFVEGKNEARKIPYSAQTRRKASTTNPRDWSSFSHCAAGWQRWPWEYSGLGFVFNPGDPFAGIDLDDCLDDVGNPKPWARADPRALQRYRNLP